MKKVLLVFLVGGMTAIISEQLLKPFFTHSAEQLAKKLDLKIGE